MDVGAPYHRRVIGARLWLDMKKIAEKIPMGFDSEENFTEVHKNGNMAN
jgi:hypothetical protein